jgi:DNA-binding IclR family transcriptional regulator
MAVDREVPGPGVEAVERALSLLHCFRAPNEQLSLALLAQRSALSKSTILRLATSLIRKGFLDRVPGGGFLLGPELRRLGRLSPPPPALADIIRPVLRMLSERAQETASFYVRDGAERICLLRQNSPRSARHHLDEGSRHPLGQGAAGLVLRAMAGDTAKDAREVRERGWALSYGHRDPELAAVACPLHDNQGVPIGALTISGLIGRFGPGEIELYAGYLTEQATALRPRLEESMLPWRAS